MRLGREHERRHLARFPKAVDLGGAAIAERVERTREEVAAGERVIYQGALRAETALADTAVEIVGVPDFLLPARRGYAIRDSKLAHRVDGPPGDRRSSSRSTAGSTSRPSSEPPVALQVHTGIGDDRRRPLRGRRDERARDARARSCASA